MLPEGIERVAQLPDDARVLDVGGWAAPLNRADWVIDVMPYASRGVLAPGGIGELGERFTEQTWLVADICAHEAWPFEDDYFDFVLCTFTLEDIRDPIRVCEEMSRVGRSGYIEVPSLLEELTWMNPELSGGRWLGHAHHRWLCWLDEGELVFLSKFHSLHTDRRFRVTPRRARSLGMEERVLSHFWEGRLPSRERVAIDEYPFEALERAVSERFPPWALEVTGRALRLRARGGAARAVSLLRRVAGGALGRLGR